MKNQLRTIVFVLIILLAACNGDSKSAKDNSSDPREVVNDAAQKLDNANSFELILAVEGSPVYLDVSNILDDAILALQRAEGEFVAPDKIRATVTVLFQDIPTEVNMLAIGEEQFIWHQLITRGQWQAETLAAGFNPASLKSDETGIANAVRSLENLEFVGNEDLDGIEVTHVRGTVEASLVQSVTVGLIGTDIGNIKADLFIRTRDGQLEKMTLEEPLREGEESPTIWTIALYGYNGDYTIEKPEINE